jgi:hypothetical protein
VEPRCVLSLAGTCDVMTVRMQTKALAPADPRSIDPAAVLGAPSSVGAARVREQTRVDADRSYSTRQAGRARGCALASLTVNAVLRDPRVGDITMDAEIDDDAPVISSARLRRNAA